MTRGGACSPETVPERLYKVRIVESRSGINWKSEAVVEGRLFGTGEAVPDVPVVLLGFSSPGFMAGYNKLGICTC